MDFKAGSNGRVGKIT